MESLEQKYNQLTESAEFTGASPTDVDNPAVKGDILELVSELLNDTPVGDLNIITSKYNGTALKVIVVRGSMRYTLYLTADVASAEPVAGIGTDEDEETPEQQEKNSSAYEKALRTATNLATEYQSKGTAGKAIDKITGGAGQKAVQAVKQAGNLAVTSLQKQNQRLAQSLNSGS